ncbi:DUF3813 domain-containing protein [Cytobacillus firmus]|jgi:hypothetical protein|uniref:DUF3813 domain-containing protein n=1 Tax=Cytobacillus TaxID=2675230 RepID=UPI0021638F79|nr:DUF3813 domain-containing protein [Cytobacillus firmus]MCS0672613.1 DUF3813 domain-containing protein [Cytobacillus firmus]MCS0790676.1 DUF3813 domain-containing protein [Cytobacillus firmus]
MGNRLFQEARKYVEIAKSSAGEETVSRAKNALSSAFANSTAAEQAQLREMQQELDQYSQNH